MTITPPDKARLTTERNELLKNFNNLLNGKKYLEGVLLLEDVITISKTLGEPERLNDYYQKISECIERFKSINDDINILEADESLRSQMLKERRDLILAAQHAAKNQEIQKAIKLYRRAVEFSLKLKDKKIIWKLSKSITLLEQKFSAEDQIASAVLIEKPVGEFRKQPVQKPFIAQPTPKPQPVQKSFIAQPTPKPQPVQKPFRAQPTPKPQPVQKPFRAQPTPKPQPVQKPFIAQPTPMQPVKKEIPFFTPPIEKQEMGVSTEIEEERVKDIFETEDKKLKRKLKLAEKVAMKKLEDAEKKYKKTSDKEEKKKEKEQKKIEKEEVKAIKFAEKEGIKAKKKEKKVKTVKIKEKSESKLPLPSDVLSEIRSFKQDKLDTAPTEIREKKKVVSGRSLLPDDVLEELRKKTSKKTR